MRSKTLVLLGAAALVLAVAAAMLVNSRGASEAAKPPPKVEQPLFPGLRDKVTDVAKIKIKRGTVETLLARGEGDKPTWVVENRGNFPADFDHIRQIVGALAEATIVEPKTAKPEFYDRLGVGEVDKPGAVGTKVDFSDASGKAMADLFIGNPSREGTSSEPGARPTYFVRRDGEAQAYVARGEFSAQPDPMTWVNRTVVDLDASKIKTTTVTRTGPDGAVEKLTVSKGSPQETKYVLENMPAGRQLKDEFAASRTAQAVVAMVMDDVAPATGMDFSKPEVTVEAHLFDGEIVTGKMLTRDGKKWWVFEAAYDEPATAGAPAEPTPTTPPDAAKPDAPKTDSPAPDAQAPDQAKETAAKAEAAKAQAATAQAAEKAAAIKHVADINEKLGPWAYVLPEYKVASLAPKLEDLLRTVESSAQPQPPPTGTATPGGPPFGPH